MKKQSKTKFATTARSALLVIVVVVATLGSVLTIGVQRSGADATTPPPWDTFNPTDGATYGSYANPAAYGAVGSLTFYNSLGQQITGGSTASPFAAYVEGSTATGGVKADLYIAIPAASDPSGWTKFTLGNSATYFPATTAPSNLASAGTLPVFTANAEESLNTFLTANPDSSNPDPGYYQVRVITSGTGSNGAVENAADIDIDTSNNTWTLAYPIASPVGTSVSLSASPPTTSVQGSSVTLTATVTDSDGSSPQGGTVQFKENGTDVGSPAPVGSNAEATLTTTDLPSGSDPLTAVFTPATGTNYSGSTSTSVPYTVTGSSIGTTTTLVASPPSSVSYGTSVAFTATVSDADSSAPTGTVTFEDGGTPIAGESDVALTGSSPYTATYTTSTLSVATHALSAVYNPPTGYSGSTGTLSFTVTGIGTTTSLSASQTSPVTYGTSVNFTALVSDADSSAPTGTVTFEDGGTPIAGEIDVALTGSSPYTATYTTSTLSVATHSLTAVYNPPAGYSSSFGALTFKVNAIGTTTTLTASPPSPVYSGTSVAFTATVSDADSSAPTGTVTFEDGGTAIAGEIDVALTGSSPYTATYTTSTLSAATHSITAVYNPPADYSSSNDALSFTVNPLKPTTTDLSVSPTSPQLLGTSETLTATVSDSDSSAPTGTVTFEDGGTAIAGEIDVALTGSSPYTATYTTSTLSAGTHELSAVYNPPAGFLSSTGTASFEVVPPPPAPPAGATGSQSATSTSTSGTATATLGNVSATGAGAGSIGVSTYSSNPSGVAISDGTGAFYDASVAGGSAFTSVTVTVCNPGSGNSLQWFNGTSWLDFSNVTTSGGCLVATVTDSTSPDIAQLTGTPIAVVIQSSGYNLVGSDGGVFNFGTTLYGSLGAQHLNKPIVGIASAPDGKGYWLVASDGGVFAFGDAPFLGSLGNLKLNQPIVGIAGTPSGNGYWLVAADGGVFAFGDAGYLGSLGNLKLNQPIVGIAGTPSGNGYWLVASDGGVFAFGDAAYLGSLGSLKLNQPIVGIATTPSGNGYWLVAADGGVFAFGDAAYLGSLGGQHLNKPIVGIVPTTTGGGYWLVAADGGVFSFGDAVFKGSTGGISLNAPIVAAAGG